MPSVTLRGGEGGSELDIQGFIWAKNFEGETGGRAGLMGHLGSPSRRVQEGVWPLLH